jgi:hypothetical protein
LAEFVCENHSNKAAKFTIEKDDEPFYFCDRCAIPLISNGFKLTKLSDGAEEEENPRLTEISEFLRQLETV